MTLSALRALAQRVTEHAPEGERPHDLPTRLWVGERDGEIVVDYWGSPFDPMFEQMLSLAGGAAVAPYLRSLSMAGPDTGANGTRNWNIEPWLEGAASFDRLRYVEIEGTRADHHNRSIVASGYEEDGALARMLDRAPCLDVLIAPSAPSSELFRGPPHPLRVLAIDVGYDHQNFVQALASSTRFAGLESIHIGEYAETYMDDFVAGCVPSEHYRALFTSAGLPAWRFMRWKNPVLAEDVIRGMARHRPQLQLQIVRSAVVSIDVRG